MTTLNEAGMLAHIDDLTDQNAALLEACETALANLSPLYSSEHLVIKRLRAAIAKAVK